jgi:hypothetical protein
MRPARYARAGLVFAAAGPALDDAAADVPVRARGFTLSVAAAA